MSEISNQLESLSYKAQQIANEASLLHLQFVVPCMINFLIDLKFLT